MHDHEYVTECANGVLRILRSDSGRQVAALSTKDWETAFFGRKFGALAVNPGAAVTLRDEDWHSALSVLVDYAVSTHYDLVELQLEMEGAPLAPSLENVGFRLVDSRVTFITRIERDAWEPCTPPFGAVRIATHADLDALLCLTHDGFTYNPAFHSRFKNRLYFNPAETERYYAAWIESHIGDAASSFVAWHVEDNLVGYSSYKRTGEHQGYPLFKALLATVAPEYRGSRAQLFMQAFLYEHIGEDRFYVNHTTQLSNYAAIKNHIASKKMLDRIELAFFWRER